MSAITDDAQINAEICRDLGSDGDLEALLSQLTVEQVRFVIARQDCGSDREAARAVGVSESAVYRWPPVVKRAVHLMAQDGVVTALHLRRRALARAMAVKVQGLNSRDERVRQCRHGAQRVGDRSLRKKSGVEWRRMASDKWPIRTLQR